MRIIDNKKDYYDYVSDIYGIDPLTTFDRRGSIVINDIFQLIYDWFPELNYEEALRLEKYQKKLGVLPVIDPTNWWEQEKNGKIKIIKNFVLEAGYKQYKFTITKERLNKNSEFIQNFKYIGTEHISEKLENVPIILKPINNKPSTKIHLGCSSIINPIIKKTALINYIPADDIWKDIYSYLLSTEAT